MDASVKELIMPVIEGLLDRAWVRFKYRMAWSWLEGDSNLQKTISKRLRKDEEGRQLKFKERKKISLLERQEAKKQEWLTARMVKEDNKSKEDDYQVDRLEEMMRCVTLMTDREDASATWRTWGSSDSERAIRMEVGDSNCIALEMMDLVEDECVEHAFLDFMHMELGMEEVRVEPGEGVRFGPYNFRMSRVR